MSDISPKGTFPGHSTLPAESIDDSRRAPSAADRDMQIDATVANLEVDKSSIASDPNVPPTSDPLFLKFEELDIGPGSAPVASLQSELEVSPTQAASSAAAASASLDLPHAAPPPASVPSPSDLHPEPVQPAPSQSDEHPSSSEAQEAPDFAAGTLDSSTASSDSSSAPYAVQAYSAADHMTADADEQTSESDPDPEFDIADFDSPELQAMEQEPQTEIQMMIAREKRKAKELERRLVEVKRQTPEIQRQHTEFLAQYERLFSRDNPEMAAWYQAMDNMGLHFDFPFMAAGGARGNVRRNDAAGADVAQ